MKILLDTNVVLDVLIAREPFANDANAVFQQIETGLHQGCLCATTVTTIEYFASQSLGAAQSRLQIGLLLEAFSVALVDEKILVSAQKSKQKDFEDAVLTHAAIASGVEAIITRNTKDFKNCGVAVFTPKEWLAARL